MTFLRTKFKGLYILNPKVYSDQRGFFLETYKSVDFLKNKKKIKFVQDNHSHSRKNVIRGLHYQAKNPQAQLITLISGEIFDVIVDLRKKSKTFGQYLSFNLSYNGIRQIFMYKGFAHGFCTLSKEANLYYKVSKFYNKDNENGLNWKDPSLSIKWPVKKPIINERDKNFPFLKEIFKKNLPNL